MTKLSYLDNSNALIIGVGEDLQVTVQDAEDLHRIFVKSQIFKPDNISLLTENKADKNNIISNLNDLKEGPNDRFVFIYFSGHGAELEGDDGSYEYYICPFGAVFTDNKAIEASAINSKKIVSIINEINANKLMVVFDCCHAQGTQKKTPNKHSIKNGKIHNHLLTNIDSGIGRVIIASCRENEESIIIRKDKNSLFTKYLLEAFRGFASGDMEYVAAHHVIFHLLNNVSQAALEHDHKQTPVITSIKDLSADFYLLPNTRKEQNKYNDKEVLKKTKEKAQNHFQIQHIETFIFNNS